MSQKRQQREKSEIHLKEWTGEERQDDSSQETFVAGGDTLSGDASNLLGKVIEQKYQIEQFIGRGGMSAVYRAKNLLLSHEIALKVLHPHLVSNPTTVRRFQLEARAAAALNHPNIVRLFDFGVTSDGLPFLAMEYLTGKALSDILHREGAIEPGRAVRLFLQIANALKEAHAQGVIHRDLKPSNIVITTDRDGNDLVKLVDFGIAKVVLPDEAEQSKLTQTGEVFGSPMYMSPEQCLGQKLDARTDIYSMGCLMYEALARCAPFQGENVLETINKQINQKPRDLKSIAPSTPDGLNNVIMRCLEKKRDDRYQNIEDLICDLNLVQQNKVVRQQMSRSARTSYWRRLIGVTVACSIVGVIGAVAAAVISTPGANLGTLLNLQLGGILDPDKDSDSLDKRAYQYYSQGKYDKAIKLLEFGVLNYREKGGQKTPYLADNLQHIGECYMLMHQYDKALPRYEEAYKIYKGYGFDRYDQSYISKCVSNMAKVLRNLGRESDASQVEEEYRNALKRRN